MPRGPNIFDTLSLVMGGVESHSAPYFFQVGTVFLIASVLVACLNLVALALAPSLNEKASDSLVAAGGSAALAWGLTAMIWLMAFIWKAYTLTEQRPTLKLRVYPGIGIGVGLVATVIILGVFSSVVLSRRRIAAWLTACSMGAVLGALMLILNVKPWTTPGLFE
jgi:hypothetical protein